MPQSRSAAPIGDRNRIIDSLRALALLGVIVMNVAAMPMRFAAKEIMPNAGAADFAAMAVDLLLFQGKARACFAFLFGVGFGILITRWREKGEPCERLFMRRMLALLAFGIVNQVFLFWGDILALYALLGMVLLLFRDLGDRALLRLGLALIIVPPVLLGLVEAFLGHSVGGIIAIDAAAEAARGRAALMSGSYVEAIAFNWSQSILRRVTDTGHMALYDTAVLGLFVLGYLAARLRILFDVEANVRLLRRIAWICLPLGLALSVLSATRLAGVRFEGPLYGAVTAAFVGPTILALGYIAVLALLFARRAAGFQAALAPVGRMALTNYLLSGALGGLYFYGYGLSQLTSHNLLGLNLFALGLFVLLAAFSHLWLALFRLGPAEWLWRSLTFGSLQPLARERPEPAFSGS